MFHHFDAVIVKARTFKQFAYCFFFNEEHFVIIAIRVPINQRGSAMQHTSELINIITNIFGAKCEFTSVLQGFPGKGVCFSEMLRGTL